MARRALRSLGEGGLKATESSAIHIRMPRAGARGASRAPGMVRYPTFHQTEKGGGSKTPTVTGRQGNANRARAVPEMDVWRKHEAEAVYVANSEPAIWPWEGGRAGVAERDPISGVTFLW